MLWDELWHWPMAGEPVARVFQPVTRLGPTISVGGFEETLQYSTAPVSEQSPTGAGLFQENIYPDQFVRVPRLSKSIR